ncbi:MAG: 4Fe-4S dicluster domain-containing protein [Marinilabiliaceae bacterium]|jgi:reductive dehalogenase|nr:4Fe-4S dicluster domain-containing protein [Marinilabiliaceae bacterium]
MGLIIAGLVGLFLLVFFLPIRGKRYKKAVPVRHLDERDTMFSRNEIKPGEDRFDEYYKLRPGKLEEDNKFRAKPGLLKEGSTYYNRMAFAAADASFEAVEAFFDLRSKSMEQGAGSKGEEVESVRVGDEENLTPFIKEWTKKMGAHSVGIAEMKDYHFYTVAGRKERYGKPVVNNHKYGIALCVEMDYELTMSGPQAPVVMESARQYLNSGMIATQLALTLRNLGYEATTHIDANYDVICPLVAKDAGLGEIGRMGLLMTPKLGPRVRIAVVTTDAPLIPDSPTHSDSVLDFCTECKKCARVCPSAAIPGDARKQHKGGLHWQVNQEACFSYWCQAGTDCGRCMAVCPYSHKSNWLHKIARWGINNNVFFRRAAIRLDDLIYGSKPRSANPPVWV